MNKLSRLDFCVLDSLADGSEPFSMIYQDLHLMGQPGWNLYEIARSVCRLLSLGMLELETADASTLGAQALVEHYASLDKELKEVGRPFYYSQGEYFFQMTTAGRQEWDKDEYRPFYQQDST